MVPILSNENSEHSYFTEISFTLENYNGLFISPQIDSINFRHRSSKPGYFSTWHVAGDPTLIIIRKGTLRIKLRDNSYQDFSAGDIFIAKDKLSNNQTFDDKIHGHTAEILGQEELLAIHIKLERQ